jgi:hypothetical protein
LDKNFDIILSKICFALRKPILAINYHQKLIYKFILSLIPFLFEKVKNVECSYLMMSKQEINVLLRSEQANIETCNSIPKDVFTKLDQIELARGP